MTERWLVLLERSGWTGFYFGVLVGMVVALLLIAASMKEHL